MSSALSRKTLQTMLTHHEALVKAWKDYFAGDKEWEWGKEAYEFHKGRVEELSGLLEKVKGRKGRKTKVSVLQPKVCKKR